MIYVGVGMFKSRIVDVITSLTLLIIALIVVDLSVVDFSLAAITTNAFNALAATVGATFSAMIASRH